MYISEKIQQKLQLKKEIEHLEANLSLEYQLNPQDPQRIRKLEKDYVLALVRLNSITSKILPQSYVERSDEHYWDAEY